MTEPKIETTALVLADRREFLCRAWNRPEPQACPKCGTRQVQIIDISSPAGWRCRECRHMFSWEPANVR